MTNDIKLHDLMSSMDAQEFATASGRATHKKMAQIRIDGTATTGDSELITQIRAHPELEKFFTQDSQTEVPIAGIIAGKFISRRIDRMLVDDDAHTVYVLDYKTDINHSTFYDKYVAQISEYATLLREICPSYKIRGFLLWLHDWTLDEIAV